MSMPSIEKRTQHRHTMAFVAPDTVEHLGEKMIGLIDDRRITKMHRYLRESAAGIPRVTAGLRVWTGGLSGPTTVRPQQSISINLANRQRPFELVGFSVGRAEENEEQVAKRYQHPERNWLGERRDITVVTLDGCPGSPSSDDSIRIEYWNDYGVGQETIVVFDDLDPVQELAWDVRGDTERHIHFEQEFCTFHGCHFEKPGHDYQSRECSLRDATLAENLQVLADLATTTTTPGA